MAAAIDGPAVNDTPTTNALSPSPLPRRALGYSARISAVLTLMIALAPTPCNTREAVSSPSVPLAAQRPDATMKTTSPPK